MTKAKWLNNSLTNKTNSHKINLIKNKEEKMS